MRIRKPPATTLSMLAVAGSFFTLYFILYFGSILYSDVFVLSANCLYLHFLSTILPIFYYFSLKAYIFQTKKTIHRFTKQTSVSFHFLQSHFFMAIFDKTYLSKLDICAENALHMQNAQQKPSRVLFYNAKSWYKISTTST